MKTKTVSGIMLTLLLTGMLALAFDVQQVKASNAVSPHIAVVPPSTVDPALTPGMNYTISINTDYNGSDVWGYEFGLTFNPHVLEGIEVVNGDLITENVATTIWNPGNFDNTAGTLSLTGNGFFSLGEPPPVTSGPGTLANITFTVVGYGDSYITFGNETRLIGYDGIIEDWYNIIDKDMPYPGHILDGYFANQLEVTHDIAVVSVTPSKTEVKQGDLLNVTVVVENQGTVDEDVTVEVYRDHEPGLTFWLVGEKSVTLEAGATESLVFVWNTTNTPPGEHSLTAVAIALPGENDVADNMLESHEIVEVTYAGTEAIYVRADGSVDPSDAPISSVDNITYIFTSDIYDSIVVQKSNIIIDGSGYSLEGPGSWGSVGFSLASIGNVTIEDINIDNFIYGIYLNSGSQTTISRSNITNNLVGVYLSNSFGNTFSGNQVTGGYFGFRIHSSDGNMVSGNNIANNTVYGVKIVESSFNNTVTLNNMTNNGYGVFINTLSFNNTICNNTLRDNIDYGIVLYTSSNNDIHGNNLANNDIGVYLGDSFDNMVFGNTITAGDGGLLLESSSNNTIFGNNITKTSLWGIRLLGASDNTVSGNNITNNAYQGIWLSGSSNNRIYGNDIRDNLYYGINFWNSSNNLIYNNDFVNNTKQAKFSYDSVNTWDNSFPSGGNYWSDYTGVDSFCGPYQNETRSDGIGDTPHLIEADNTDNYPLMKPYAGPYDIGITNVTTSKSAVSKGYRLNVTIKIVNYGIATETFNVTAYANTTEIDTHAGITLTGRNSTTITLTWDTTGFAYGNYTIRAVADTVPGETDTADNTFIGDTVFVKIPGDVDGDLDVDYDDFIVLAGAYGSSSEHPAYRPEADFDNDSDVDYDDFINLAGNYGKTI